MAAETTVDEAQTEDSGHTERRSRVVGGEMLPEDFVTDAEAEAKYHELLATRAEAAEAVAAASAAGETVDDNHPAVQHLQELDFTIDDLRVSGVVNITLADFERFSATDPATHRQRANETRALGQRAEAIAKELLANGVGISNGQVGEVIRLQDKIAEVEQRIARALETDPNANVEKSRQFLNSVNDQLAERMVTTYK